MNDQPKTRRSAARQLLTRESEYILNSRYRGQVRATVIERALKRMAELDRKQAEREARRRRQEQQP